MGWRGSRRRLFTRDVVYAAPEGLCSRASYGSGPSEMETFWSAFTGIAMALLGVGLLVVVRGVVGISITTCPVMLTVNEK